MRNIVSGLEPRARAASTSVPPGERVQTYAVYGALGLIAAIVFGTLSYHPF